MATLREYFDTDFPLVLTSATVLKLSGPTTPSTEVPARVHYDFNSGSKYLSCFVPSSARSAELCQALLSNPQWPIEAIEKGVEVHSGYPHERTVKAADLKFSGRYFLYTEDQLSAEQITALEQTGQQHNLDVIVRTPVVAQYRAGVEKPLAFICHDSRDKEQIARPIALGLSKKLCPVWYDEYSLKVGDSLRASIEKGLKECKKCILIISPNFIGNNGWPKTEFDSVFTRQILEGSNVVVPVWCGVTKQQVYEYSPSLLDRVAARLEEDGIEEVLRKLYQAIEPPVFNYKPV